MGIPPEWNKLKVSSIFKSGNQADPANYRGISVMSFFPKLYALVQLQRLDATAEEQGLRAQTQAGFRKGARIEDNILLLTTTMHRAVKLR